MWEVHKFGGTSVGNADCMQKCINIVKDAMPSARIAMVVSAMGGKPKVTDMLLNSVHSAAANDHDGCEQLLEAIHKKHVTCLQNILDDAPKEAYRIMDSITADLSNIRDLLKAVSLMRMAHHQILELVSGYGELWSAKILSAAMRQQGLPFVFINARDVLVVRSDESAGVEVEWDISQDKLNQYMKTLPKIDGHEPGLVITGYIASSTDGVATTLKRDGSDFSASIFGKLLGATAVTIWTDVSGVYSADPRRVPDAQIIDNVSYTEAIELAYFGAKVIHPKTMAPAIQAKIPIYIRNTFDPEASGTRIFLAPRDNSNVREKCVCGFSTVDNVALLNIEGTGMVGVSGIAMRLFSALEEADIPVLFIAQASSEHSICFATRMTHVTQAKSAIETKFYFELSRNLISAVSVIEDCSIIAAVGESMSNMPGVSGIFFGALGKAKVNVLSISQGCDERNISAVVKQVDSAKALQLVHSAFWLSAYRINICVIGTGNVGSALIQSLIEQIPLIEDRFDATICIRGVMNSTKMLLGEDLTPVMKDKLKCFRPRGRGLSKSYSNLSLEDLQNHMASGDGTEHADIDKFVNYCTEDVSSPHTILIDCSTSEEIGLHHADWLMKGINVVTANKSQLVSSLDVYNDLLTAIRSASSSYSSEVTIGASIPTMTTLHDILMSGDAVHKIEGIMNVSCQLVLSYVMDGMSLCDSIKKVREHGVFEVDPFTDLTGEESVSKLLILARFMGANISMEDVEIDPMVKRIDGVDFNDIQGSDIFDEADKLMRERVKSAKVNKCTLRYVQRLLCDPPIQLGMNNNHINIKATISLEEVPYDSELGSINGPVYSFSFHTERYKDAPLCVKGPLSNSANTASGILADILRIARHIGVKDKGQANIRKKATPHKGPIHVNRSEESLTLENI